MPAAIGLARQRCRAVRTTSGPPALRASGCGATTTHAVSLPSMMRWTRSHVVNGIRVEPPSWRSSARSIATNAKPPGLQHEVERLQRDGRSTRLVDCRRVSQIVPANPEQAIGLDAAARLMRHRNDRRCRPRGDLAARVAAAIICSSSVVRPSDRGPTISDNCPRGSPPVQTGIEAAMEVGMSADRRPLERWQRRGQRAIELAARRADSRTASGLIRHIFRLQAKI
jgi:hypothetical protein